MTRQEYEIVKKLRAIGYDAILKLSEDAYLMKAKRIYEPNIGEAPGSSTLEPALFAMAQKYGYRLKEIDVEQYDAETNKIVPFAFFVKPYEY